MGRANRPCDALAVRIVEIPKNLKTAANLFPVFGIQNSSLFADAEVSIPAVVGNCSCRLRK
jgi:hypothetical protein